MIHRRRNLPICYTSIERTFERIGCTILTAVGAGALEREILLMSIEL